MLKDIEQHKVEKLQVAIIPSEKDDNFWDVYIVNEYDKMIHGVMITSYGYGEIDEKKVETTKLRHFFEGIPAHSASKLEPIQKDCLELTNEYWVSFKLDDYLYDKKFIFVKGTISKQYLTNIPLMSTKGVLHP